MRSAKKIVVALAAAAATVWSAGGAEAAMRHHRHEARHHHQSEHFGRYSEDTCDGVYSRHDDRVYGGAYYGFYGSPLYGRVQSY